MSECKGCKSLVYLLQEIWSKYLRFRETGRNLAETLIFRAKSMRDKHGLILVNIILCPASHTPRSFPKRGVWRFFLSGNTRISLPLFQFPFQNVIELKHGVKTKRPPHALTPHKVVNVPIIEQLLGHGWNPNTELYSPFLLSL